MLEDQSSIPKDLQYLKNWYDDCVSSIFYRDFQHSMDSRNAATFKSLGLVLRGKKEFEFLRSGLKISFETGEEKVSNIRITNSHYWKGLSYGIDVQLDTYDPEDDFYSFLVMRQLLSLSREQVLANFINTFTVPDDNQASLERFILDLNAKNKIDIDYSADMNLKDVSQEITKKMPDFNYYWAAYNTYIHTDTVVNTRNNISTFYRSLSPINFKEKINSTLLPSGDLQFSEKNTLITLPKKFFKYASDHKKELVSFYIRSIEYDLIYNQATNDYEMKILIYPRQDSGLKEMVRFKYKYRNVFTEGKEKRDFIEVKTDDFEAIEIIMRKKTFSIIVESKDSGLLPLYKDFKIK